MNADQILDAEMQSHAEHEQGNPDLRQLLSLMGICDQPGCERTHGDAREQVSDDGGQPDQPGEVAGDERRAQRDGDGGDEVGAVDLDRILQISVKGGGCRLRMERQIDSPMLRGTRSRQLRDGFTHIGRAWSRRRTSSCWGAAST